MSVKSPFTISKDQYQRIFAKMRRAYPTVSHDVIQDTGHDSVILCYQKYGNFYFSETIWRNRLIDILRRERKTIDGDISTIPSYTTVEDSFCDAPFTLYDFINETSAVSKYGMLWRDTINEFVEFNKPAVPKSPKKRTRIIATWVYFHWNPPVLEQTRVAYPVKIPALISFCKSRGLCFDTLHDSIAERKAQFAVNRLIKCFKQFCRNNMEAYQRDALLFAAQTHGLLHYGEVLPLYLCRNEQPRQHASRYHAIRANCF
ncbi:MAG: hypothetical protein JW795_19895 [Chitinivibrionales bacterium]|nr:hypothetical protein [Chitinivibrionales bacterium]